MKVALVHDYLTQRGGAERVFELLCDHFPKADIYTSIYDPKGTVELRGRLVNTTILQRIPGAARYFRMFAPLYFPAFRALDLQQYDLILSSTSSFAKSVKKRSDATHVCFCHNVTRFLWDTDTYLKGFGRYQVFHPFLKPIFQKMRKMDLKYAQEPDVYIANSSVVAQRVRDFYKQPARVINYPIDDSRFLFSAKKENYFLVASRLLSYKRIDLIIEAFNQLRWPLVIIGEGPERARLEVLAESNITFLGHVSDEQRRQFMAKARMVVVAALEDYGLVPIEANISGTPVVSYGAGGVLDTQKLGLTGFFFEEQTSHSLRKALQKAVQVEWDSSQIREYALTNFTRSVFFEAVDNVIQEALEDRSPVSMIAVARS